MAMTPAEKQRRYRQRHLGVNGQKERLQCMVSAHAKAQLTRLAHYHGYSVTRLIETFAAQAERALVDMLPHPDIGPYLDGRLQCNRAECDPCPTRPVDVWTTHARQADVSTTVPASPTNPQGQQKQQVANLLMK